MKTKASPQNKFLRVISVPIRALGKARDMYVKSMTDYADKVNYTSKVVRVSAASGLQKSFSVSSVRPHDNEDFRELVRAASARSLGDVCMAQEMKIRTRSSSVAMGRIDEDSPFGDSHTNDISLKSGLEYPRSKSHAITRRRAF